MATSCRQSFLSTSAFYLLVFTLFPYVFSQQPLPTRRLKSCGDHFCNAPLSEAVAIASYSTHKAGHLTFKEGDTITIFARFLSAPQDKFFEGAVLNEKGERKRGLFPRNMVKEMFVFIPSPILVDESVQSFQPVPPVQTSTPLPHEVTELGDDKDSTDSQIVDEGSTAQLWNKWTSVLPSNMETGVGRQDSLGNSLSEAHSHDNADFANNEIANTEVKAFNSTDHQSKSVLDDNKANVNYNTDTGRTDPMNYYEINSDTNEATLPESVPLDPDHSRQEAFAMMKQTYGQLLKRASPKSTLFEPAEREEGHAPDESVAQEAFNEASSENLIQENELNITKKPENENEDQFQVDDESDLLLSNEKQSSDDVELDKERHAVENLEKKWAEEDEIARRKALAFKQKLFSTNNESTHMSSLNTPQQEVKDNDNRIHENNSEDNRDENIKTLEGIKEVSEAESDEEFEKAKENEVKYKPAADHEEHKTSHNSTVLQKQNAEDELEKRPTADSETWKVEEADSLRGMAEEVELEQKHVAYTELEKKKVDEAELKQQQATIVELEKTSVEEIELQEKKAEEEAESEKTQAAEVELEKNKAEEAELQEKKAKEEVELKQKQAAEFELEKQRAEEVELKKKVAEEAAELERKRATEVELEKKIAEEVELQKKEAEDEAELERKRAAEVEFERKRAEEAELQKKKEEDEAELERKRAAEVELERKRAEEAELQKKKEEDEAELERKQAAEVELERKRAEEAEQQKKKAKEEAELKQKRAAEFERKRAEEAELEQKRAAEFERKRAEEAELQKKKAEEAELERKRTADAELERKRAEEAELQKKKAEEEAELGRQRAAEFELERKRAEEAEQQKKKAKEEAELEQKRAAEFERKRAEEVELEKRKAKEEAEFELEKKRMEEAELQKKKAKEEAEFALEKKRMEEAELQKKKAKEEAELERKRAAEVEFEKKRAEEAELEQKRAAEVELGRNGDEDEFLTRKAGEADSQRKQVVEDKLERKKTGELEMERNTTAQLEKTKVEELKDKRLVLDSLRDSKLNEDSTDASSVRSDLESTAVYNRGVEPTPSAQAEYNDLPVLPSPPIEDEERSNIASTKPEEPKGFFGAFTGTLSSWFGQGQGVDAMEHDKVATADTHKDTLNQMEQHLGSPGHHSVKTLEPEISQEIPPADMSNHDFTHEESASSAANTGEFELQQNRESNPFHVTEKGINDEVNVDAAFPTSDYNVLRVDHELPLSKVVSPRSSNEKNDAPHDGHHNHAQHHEHSEADEIGSPIVMADDQPPDDNELKLASATTQPPTHDERPLVDSDYSQSLTNGKPREQTSYPREKFSYDPSLQTAEQLPSQRPNEQPSSPVTAQYPKRFADGQPIIYLYDAILATVAPGVEAEMWKISRTLPEQFQPILASEPFGLTPPGWLLFLFLGLCLSIAFIWTMLCYWISACFEGFKNVKQLRAHARDQAAKLHVTEVELLEQKSKMQDLQNEAAIAQEETRLLRRQVEEKQAEIDRFKISHSDLEQKYKTVIDELTQARVFCGQWETYAKQQEAQVQAGAEQVQALEVILREERTNMARLSNTVEELKGNSGLSSEMAEKLQTTISSMEEEIKMLRESKRKVEDLNHRKDEREKDLQKSLVQIKNEKTELESMVKFKDSEVALLKDCLAEIRACDESGDDSTAEDREERVRIMMDTSKARSDLKLAQEQLKELTHRIEEENDSRKHLERSIVDLQCTHDKLKSDSETALREKEAAQQNLIYMTALYEKANSTVSRLMESQQNEASNRDTSLVEYQRQIVDLRAEVATWRQQLADKEEEYKNGERDLRKHVMESEKKAHESWLAHRESERRSSSMRQELLQLKDRQAFLEASLRDSESSYKALLLEMDLERSKARGGRGDDPRDDREDSASVSSRLRSGRPDRPLSRNSTSNSRTNLSRTIDRSSQSPYEERVTSEQSSHTEAASPAKPVDPRRAPPPSSTYRKGDKVKTKTVKSRKSLSPVDPPRGVHTPSELQLMNPGTFNDSFDHRLSSQMAFDQYGQGLNEGVIGSDQSHNSIGLGYDPLNMNGMNFDPMALSMRGLNPLASSNPFDPTMAIGHVDLNNPGYSTLPFNPMSQMGVNDLGQHPMNMNVGLDPVMYSMGNMMGPAAYMQGLTTPMPGLMAPNGNNVHPNPGAFSSINQQYQNQAQQHGN